MRIFALILLPLAHLPAAELDPNNILVSIGNSIAGQSVPYNSVREFTPGGALVQTIGFNYNGGSYPATEYLRDIVVSENGSIYGYNGTFSPFLTGYSVASGTFSHTTLPGWSTVNNVTYGGLAAFRNFVFATDMRTFGSPAEQANGIVRFETTTNTATRFADGIDFIDLNIGLDGKLYGLFPGGSPGGTNVNVYDPVTTALLDSITLPSSISFSDALRSIAVDQTGRMFVSGLGGVVYRFDSNGMLETSNSTGFANLTDIDIDETGRIILGQTDGRVILGDSTLTSFTTFLAINDPRATAWTIFVSFAKPIPEPSTLSLGFAALLLCAAVKKRL